MGFWIIALVLLASAVLSVLFPLARNRSGNRWQVDSTAVYKEQLADVEAQLANLPNSAPKRRESLEAERAEVARRLLRASKKDASSANLSDNRSYVKAASLVALLFVPLASLAFYASLGSVGTADFPLSARQQAPLEERPVEDLVALAENHLKSGPDDPRGWAILADVYGKLNQPAKRANAIEQLMRISGETPELLTDLGEALTIAGGNIVPERAKKMFETALKSEPNMRKANIYLALALDQEGKTGTALSIWRKLKEKPSDDENWVRLVNSQIARLSEKVQDVRPVEVPDRSDILAMVEGLANRLEDEPGTPQEWARLIRSYGVLRLNAKAEAALQRAVSQFAGQEDTISMLQSVFDESVVSQ
ncbi:MAG: c-type cytochrome biogenesis protein CcmI [Pseudomonadota bacterium]